MKDHVKKALIRNAPNWINYMCAKSDSFEDGEYAAEHGEVSYHRLDIDTEYRKGVESVTE
jgi:hypothetical protein